MASRRHSILSSSESFTESEEEVELIDGDDVADLLPLPGIAVPPRRVVSGPSSPRRRCVCQTLKTPHAINQSALLH